MTQTKYVLRLIAFLFLIAVALGCSMVRAQTDGKVKLKWVFRYQEAADAALERFYEQYPNIEIDTYDMYNAVQWDMSKFIVQMVAGTAPDVYEMWPPHAREWMERGLLLDLSPCVDRDLSEDDIEDFPPLLWEVSQIDGFRYGIPRYINAGCIWYNKDIISSVGLLDPHQLEQKGEWNWSSLLDIARKATKRDSEDKVAIYGFERKHPWECWVWSNGGRICNWPDDPTEVMLDSPEAKQALDWLCSLIWDYGVSPTYNIRWNYDFREGNVAMSDAWGISSLKDNYKLLKDDWNMAPFPLSAKGMRKPYTFVDMWGIYADTDHPDEAWKFVRFLIQPEIQTIFARMQGEMPSRISAMSNMIEMYSGVNMQYAIESAITARPVPAAIMPNWTKVAPIMDEIEQKIMADNQAAAPVLKDAARRMRAIFEEYVACEY